jgi:asparagine synthase (glutamine-hydrolysing)
MCGILLYKTKDIEKVKQPFDIIKNRGPDGTVLISAGKYVLGHHRLSIVKLESGQQPIIKKYGNTTYTLVCNGEIYNYDKLIQKNISSDCEVIIDTYIKKKLSNIDGDFAFILHTLDDEGNENIITGRDIVGLKPLYLGYNKSGKLVGASSEIKVLEAIEHRIIIKNHPIGVIIDHGSQENINIMPQIKQINDDDIKSIINTIKKLIYESVKKRLFHSERPITVLCSGGIDSVIISSIVIDIINKNCQDSKKKLELYTLSYSKDSYDLIYANIFYNFVKEKYPWVKFTTVELDKQIITDENIKNTISTIESYDPNSIRAAMPMYFLAKYISKNSKYKVVLSGEGADELFMGYNYFSNDGVTSNEAAEESRRLVNNLHSFDLLRAERVFSANGLELRVPFLDKDVISYVTNLPGDIRLPINGTEKYLLRIAFEDTIRNILSSEKNVFDTNNLRDDNREINNLIFRQKDRLSDGISGKWVPDLLSHIVGEKPGLNTDGRLHIEKECYKKIYSSIFSNDVIVNRKLPEWAEDKTDKNVLNNVVEDRLKEFKNTDYVNDINVAKSNKSLETEKIEKVSSKSFSMNLSYDPNVF